MTDGTADHAEPAAQTAPTTQAVRTEPAEEREPAEPAVAGEAAAPPEEAAAGSDRPPPSTDEPSSTANDTSVRSDNRSPGSSGAAPSAEGTRPAADFRTALVSAVTVDLPNQHPTVTLRESESPRRQLSFSVSLQDGVVLSHAVRRIPTPRPLTHELLSEVLSGFDIDLVAVRLVGRRGAVYFAELDLRGRTGRSVHSCRPSDGLAVALMQPVPVPILIDVRLFEEVGDVIPNSTRSPS